MTSCGIWKCAVMVLPSLFLPQEHLSKDSQSTSTQLIAINKSSIGAIPLECNSFIIDNRQATISS